jgi:hypothetical protein
VFAPGRLCIQYAAASRLITGASGILDHPLSRVTTSSEFQTHLRTLAAHYARVMPLSSALKTEGVGNAGCPLHPQPPVQQKSTGVEATGTPGSPGIPARNGFNSLFRALPGDRALLSPSPRAVSCARLERQRRGVRTTRLRRPLSALSSKAPLTSTASHPASVTIAIRPSSGTRRADSAFDLGSRSTTPVATD